MKLLEILQKELKEFPEGMLYAVQDDDGEVKFGKHSQPTLFWESGVWYRKHKGENFLIIPGLELAEDRDSAIVTKDMWGNDRVKQIIVNVNGLSEEEKQCVNEALAKITGATKLPTFNPKAGWFLAPESLDSMRVTWDWLLPCGEPTHTPQQVLEMAGMATNRKVRKDFDPKQPISVDVSSCTHREKCEVQQAFFDVGIEWAASSAKFRYLNAVLYTNSTPEGTCSEHLMYGTSPRTDSISHQQFLSMVYEEEQKGHIHADLMSLYAEDAKTTGKPWELWQIKDARGEWRDLTCNPSFATHLGYRRKPKTKIINGVEIPDFQFTPYVGCNFYCANIGLPEFYETGNMGSADCTFTKRMVERGLIYPYTEEGKQAAIQHAKIMLGIA